MCAKSFFSKNSGLHLSYSMLGLMVFCFLFLTCQAAVGTAETRQHGTHVHGIGTLNVAFDGKDLIIELESPAANVFGFEHAPENEQQNHKVEAAFELLLAGEEMFNITPKAKCRLHGADIDSDMAKGHSPEHHHEHDRLVTGHTDNAGHSDLRVTYHFECESPRQLKAIDVMLFSYFPGFEEIEVQLLTPKKQTAVELTPQKFKISL